MDKYHAFELGLAFGRGLMINKQAVSESMATDELQWITLKPKGQESEGYKHVQIDTETKTIVKGFGSGKTLAEAFKPKSEKIKEKLKDSVIQNRDRSSASSREQIRQISVNPDYDRLGTSKTFTDGSPVVAFGKIPSKAYGKETRIVDSEGKKYTVKYAVVEADTLASSHDEQGFTNKEYSDVNNLDTVRAIAGNGRTAGIKSAYAKGMKTAQGNSLAEDTMEDGFVTLTDKNGNQYVAQCGTEEKERYKKTGKPLSKVNKEKKENKKFYENTDIESVSDKQKDYALRVKQNTLRKIRESLEKKGVELSEEENKKLNDFASISSATFWLNNKDDLGFGNRKTVKLPDLERWINESQRSVYKIEKKEKQDNVYSRIAEERKKELSGLNIPKEQKILMNPIKAVFSDDNTVKINNPTYFTALEKMSAREAAKYGKTIELYTDDVTVHNGYVQAMNDNAYSTLKSKGITRSFID